MGTLLLCSLSAPSSLLTTGMVAFSPVLRWTLQDRFYFIFPPKILFSLVCLMVLGSSLSFITTSSGCCSLILTLFCFTILSVMFFFIDLWSVGIIPRMLLLSQDFLQIFLGVRSLFFLATTIVVSSANVIIAPQLMQLLLNRSSLFRWRVSWQSSLFLEASANSFV